MDNTDRRTIATPIVASQLKVGDIYSTTTDARCHQCRVDRIEQATPKTILIHYLSAVDDFRPGWHSGYIRHRLSTTVYLWS